LSTIHDGEEESAFDGQSPQRQNVDAKVSPLKLTYLLANILQP
jgi:hypothetical protein